jgi:DNA-binding transcriptional MerR regulator
MTTPGVIACRKYCLTLESTPPLILFPEGGKRGALRHYERMRVLPSPRRTPAGYRQYPAEAADRVRLVRRAMALGFSLEELSKILTVRDRGGAPCRQVHALALQKLVQLDRRSPTTVLATRWMSRKRG